jgi:hypothetical protein
LRTIDCVMGGKNQVKYLNFSPDMIFTIKIYNFDKLFSRIYTKFYLSTFLIRSAVSIYLPVMWILINHISPFISLLVAIWAEWLLRSMQYVNQREINQGEDVWKEGKFKETNVCCMDLKDWSNHKINFGHYWLITKALILFFR